MASWHLTRVWFWKCQPVNKPFKRSWLLSSPIVMSPIPGSSINNLSRPPISDVHFTPGLDPSFHSTRLQHPTIFSMGDICKNVSTASKSPMFSVWIPTPILIAWLWTGPSPVCSTRSPPPPIQVLDHMLSFCPACHQSFAPSGGSLAGSPQDSPNWALSSGNKMACLYRRVEGERRWTL